MMKGELSRGGDPPRGRPYGREDHRFGEFSRSVPPLSRGTTPGGRSDSRMPNLAGDDSRSPSPRHRALPSPDYPYGRGRPSSRGSSRGRGPARGELPHHLLPALPPARVRDDREGAIEAFQTIAVMGANARPLREVDPFASKHIFAALDDGCSRSCWSQYWATNAADKGISMSELYGKPSTYEGIGTNTALGKRRLRMLVHTLTGNFVHGTIVGNELSGDITAPLLLSDPAQATLGVCKDSRTGMCTIRVDPDTNRTEPVELFRFRGTNLKGLCISGDYDSEPFATGEEVESFRPISIPGSSTEGSEVSAQSKTGGAPPPKSKAAAAKPALVPKPPASRPRAAQYRQRLKEEGLDQLGPFSDEEQDDFDSGGDQAKQFDAYLEAKGRRKRLVDAGSDDDDAVETPGSSAAGDHPRQDVPDFSAEEVTIPSSVLNAMYEHPKKRSYFTWFEGHRVVVKRNTSSTHVEVKRGYESCVKSSWAWVEPRSDREEGGWMRVEDRRPIQIAHHVYGDDGGDVTTDVVVLIHKEHLQIKLPNPPGTGKRALKRARREAEEAERDQEKEEKKEESVEESKSEGSKDMEKDRKSDSRPGSDDAEAASGAAAPLHQDSREYRAGARAASMLSKTLDELSHDDPGPNASRSSSGKQRGRGKGSEHGKTKDKAKTQEQHGGKDHGRGGAGRRDRDRHFHDRRGGRGGGSTSYTSYLAIAQDGMPVGVLKSSKAKELHANMATIAEGDFRTGSLLSGLVWPVLKSCTIFLIVCSALAGAIVGQAGSDGYPARGLDSSRSPIPLWRAIREE